MLRTVVALITYTAIAVATAACMPYKARDAERNEGGGSSMYRAADPARLP
jgi:hypothetical protein